MKHLKQTTKQRMPWSTQNKGFFEASFIHKIITGPENLAGLIMDILKLFNAIAFSEYI